MRFLSVLAASVVCFTAASAEASLIAIGPDSLSGQGLGAVQTVLTFQTANGRVSTESGCVSAGVGGTTVTGLAACPGSGPNGGNAFTGGDEHPSQNQAYAATALGLTDFNDLRILFNAAEPSGDGIQLDNLSLTLWNPTTGTILDAYYIVDPVPFASTDPGLGNAGFFFGLDSTQAATANSLLAANPGLFLGLAANASDAAGASETFSFGVVEDEEPVPDVPEPMTLTILGFGLAGLGALSVKRSR
jgi:hypothetical protein